MPLINPYYKFMHSTTYPDTRRRLEDPERARKPKTLSPEDERFERVLALISGVHVRSTSALPPGVALQGAHSLFRPTVCRNLRDRQLQLRRRKRTSWARFTTSRMASRGVEERSHRRGTDREPARRLSPALRLRRFQNLVGLTQFTSRGPRRTAALFLYPLTHRRIAGHAAIRCSSWPRTRCVVASPADAPVVAVYTAVGTEGREQVSMTARGWVNPNCCKYAWRVLALGMVSQSIVETA